MPRIYGQFGQYVGAGPEPDGQQLARLSSLLAFLERPTTDLVEDFTAGADPSQDISYNIPYWSNPARVARYGYSNLAINCPLLFNVNGQVSVPVSGQTWTAAAGGANDTLWLKMFNAIKNAGYPNAILRFNHEFNGNFYAWTAASDAGNGYVNFIAAHQRAAGLARGVSSGFRIGFNPLAFSANASITATFPGTSYVDILMADWYDDASTLPAGAARYGQQYNGIANGWADLFDLFGQYPTLPVGFPEWGTGTGGFESGGDNGFFMNNFKSMLQWLGPRLDHQLLYYYTDSNIVIPGNYSSYPKFSDEYFAAFGPARTPTRSTARPSVVQSSTGSAVNSTGNGLTWSLPTTPSIGNKILAVLAVDNNSGGVLWGTASWEAIGVYAISSSREIRVYARTVAADQNPTFTIGCSAAYGAIISLLEVQNLHDIQVSLGSVAGSTVTYKEQPQTLALSLFQWDANSHCTITTTPSGATVTSGEVGIGTATVKGSAVVDTTTNNQQVGFSALQLSSVGTGLLLLSGLLSSPAGTPPTQVQSQTAVGNTLTLGTLPTAGNTLVAIYCSDSDAGLADVQPPLGWRKRANANDGAANNAITVSSLYVTDPANMATVTFQSATSVGRLTVIEFVGPVDVDVAHGLPNGGPKYNTTSQGSFNFPIQTPPANAAIIGAVAANGYDNVGITISSGAGSSISSGIVHSGSMYWGSSVFNVPVSSTSIVGTMSNSHCIAMQCAVIVLTPA